MASKISFTFEDRELRRNVDELEVKLDRAVDIAVDTAALRGQVYLKTDAPWHDRTGAARTGLHTVARKARGAHEIIFAHAVHYGIWLEVKFSGRDEVIMPTVLKTGRELMRSLNGLMGKI